MQPECVATSTGIYNSCTEPLKSVPEVLYDDLLYVSILHVQLVQLCQGYQSVLTALTNANQNT